MITQDASEATGWVRYVPGETVINTSARYALIGPGGAGCVLGLYVENRRPTWIYRLPVLPKED